MFNSGLYSAITDSIFVCLFYFFFLAIPPSPFNHWMTNWIRKKNELSSFKLITTPDKPLFFFLVNPTETWLILVKIKYSTGIYSCGLLSGLTVYNNARSDEKHEWLPDEPTTACCCCTKEELIRKKTQVKNYRYSWSTT